MPLPLLSPASPSDLTLYRLDPDDESVLAPLHTPSTILLEPFLYAPPQVKPCGRKERPRPEVVALTSSWAGSSPQPERPRPSASGAAPHSSSPIIAFVNVPFRIVSLLGCRCWPLSQPLSALSRKGIC